MNLANKLTLLRVIIVPFFVLFMSVGAIPMNYLWALLLFAAASITDLFDGKIARKYNMVTDFGKFLDPLADKILVAAALVCFNELHWAPAWVTVIVLIREFAVSGVRLLAASSDKKAVIPANIWGKLKTAATMISICAILVLRILEQLSVIQEIIPAYRDFYAPIPEVPIMLISNILMYITAALTLISGVKYLYDYREYINPNK
ncbi:MAG: CDP-diacylglycerol--glycerol-3-phosphate 3-phosphatidyltransferase [Oscillospiraceae bacterium]